MVARTPDVPLIRGFEPASLTAWEGRVAAVISLQGCNFSCPLCPVPHLVPRSEEVPGIPLESVLEAIYQRRRWLDAVVVAGGEATLHAGLGDLLRVLLEFGLRVRLHTNGSKPEALKVVVGSGEVACVSMSVRGPLDPTYAVAVGAQVRLAAIYESIEFLLRAPIDHEFRVPWLPHVVEGDQIASILRMLAGARRVVLEPAPDGSPGVRALRRVARLAGHNVESCALAGRPGEDFGARHRARKVVS